MISLLLSILHEGKRRYRKMERWVTAILIIRTGFLREVAGIIERNQLRCLIGGSFGFAALLGEMPRHPHDVDLCFLEGERQSIERAFREAGFVLKSGPYSSLLTKHRLFRVDLFCWKSAENAQVEWLRGDGTLMRVPRSFFDSGIEVTVDGLRFTIASRELLACMRSILRSRKKEAFFDRVGLDGLIHEEVSRRTVLTPVEVELHSFTAASQAAQALPARRSDRISV